MQLKLISFNLCPYVHRAIIMLNEKGIEYEIEYIDLKNKPEWFLKISPLGKVPVLLVDGKPLFESLAILEFLDEYFEPRVHPTDLFLRARHRAYLPIVDELFVQSYQLSLADTNEKVDSHMDIIRAKFTILSENLELPFFASDKWSMVDIAIAPFFYRMDILKGSTPELFKGNDKVKTWSNHLLECEIVNKGLVDNFNEIYLQYFKNSNSILIN